MHITSSTTPIDFGHIGARQSVEHKYSMRVMQWVEHNGTRVLHCMGAMGGPFHIDQLIVLWPELPRREILAVIHYINESDAPLHIQLAQYGRARRWCIVYCSGLHKSQLRAKWLLHRAQSRRPNYPQYSSPVDFDITEL